LPGLITLFANSGMDGFAVRSVDVSTANREQPVRLAVITDIPAGRVTSLALQPGQAARIMTGAAVPEGDAVVPLRIPISFTGRRSTAPAQVRFLHP
jgi:molybdopterin molybdotransferase